MFVSEGGLGAAAFACGEVFHISCLEGFSFLPRAIRAIPFGESFISERSSLLRKVLRPKASISPEVLPPVGFAVAGGLGLMGLVRVCDCEVICGVAPGRRSAWGVWELAVGRARGGGRGAQCTSRTKPGARVPVQIAKLSELG